MVRQDKIFSQKIKASSLIIYLVSNPPPPPPPSSSSSMAAGKEEEEAFVLFFFSGAGVATDTPTTCWQEGANGTKNMENATHSCQFFFLIVKKTPLGSVSPLPGSSSLGGR